jgi:hypothetical protein
MEAQICSGQKSRENGIDRVKMSPLMGQEAVAQLPDDL